MEQVYDLFVEPELERRRAEGSLPDEFALVAVQVVLRLGEEPEVRLNDEAQIIGEAEVEPPVERGDRLELSPEQIQSLRPTADDPNAAHITMLRASPSSPKWKVSFDFRYNAERVAQNLEAAREFLHAAEESLEAGRLRPFVANLFTASERAATGLLVQLPRKAFVESESHSFVKSEFNRWGRKHGLTEPEHVELLNKLYEMRDDARYGGESFELEQSTAKEMLQVADDLVKTIEEQAPTRRTDVPDEVEEA